MSLIVIYIYLKATKVIHIFIFKYVDVPKIPECLFNIIWGGEGGGDSLEKSYPTSSHVSSAKVVVVVYVFSRVWFLYLSVGRQPVTY